MFVFGEKVVENPQSGLEIKVDNVLWSGLWFGHASILHQVKGQAYICHFLFKALWGQMEVIQWNKISF